MKCQMIIAVVVLATVQAKPLRGGLNAVTGIAQAGIGAATGLASGIGNGVGTGVGASLDAVTNLVKGVGSGLTSGLGAGLASSVGSGFASSVGAGLGNLLLGGMRGNTNYVTVGPHVLSGIDAVKNVVNNSPSILDSHDKLAYSGQVINGTH